MCPLGLTSGLRYRPPVFLMERPAHTSPSTETSSGGNKPPSSVSPTSPESPESPAGDDDSRSDIPAVDALRRGPRGDGEGDRAGEDAQEDAGEEEEDGAEDGIEEEDEEEEEDDEWSEEWMALERAFGERIGAINPRDEDEDEDAG